MSLKNSSTRYGSVAKAFHWLTALLILAAIPLGLIANNMPPDTSEALARKAQLFSLHKTLGVAIFLVALARIAWALTQSKPTPLHPERKLERFLAGTAHWLLYGSLLLVPLSGWIHHAATTGFAPILWPFGQGLPFVPQSDQVARVAIGAHIVFQRVLIIALILHVAGALKHHLIDRDDTLRRMGFGPVSSAATEHAQSNARHVGAALLVWALALSAGLGVGTFEEHSATAATPELAGVKSAWTVNEGTIAISVTQFAATLEGRFSSWTAAINFEESSDQRRLGDVNVEISIPSLTLGSVTQQALGPDYFAAADFPTARFIAEISRGGAGYLAEGTLTLRGVTVPVSLPFELTTNGNQATMTGSTTLDRRDFGMTVDDTNVLYPVEVRVSLDATRE